MTGNSLKKHIDVVYLYKANNTHAFRYSLRSLVNVPVRNVIVVGDLPEWIQNVHYIPHTFGSNKIMNAWNQLLRACEATDEFLLFNDDFYIFQPLNEYAYHKADMRKSGRYQKAYERTKRLFPNFKNYEVHAPMHINSLKFQELRSIYDLTNEYLHRSLYGNHYQISGKMIKDNKIYSTARIDNLRGLFASTTDLVEISQEFVSTMSQIFNEKSIYERRSH